MNKLVLIIIFVLLIVLVDLFLYNVGFFDSGKQLKGENWQAKQYGHKYVVSLSNGVDVEETLTDFIRVENIKAGTISGLGAVNSATLRFYNPKTKIYTDKTFDEQMEISNLIGNISQKDGKEYLHLHATFGKEDYTALAGHLLTATISGAGEFFIEEISYAKIGRKVDENLGLNVYDFGLKD